MGLDYSTAEFLYALSKRGVSLGRALILGRQNVYMTASELATVRNWTGVHLRNGDFADEYFRALGGTRISFLDRCDHEAADIVHDLNLPLPSEFHAQFDTVLDGGTLEHVFNFPVGLRTCMEAVKKGGHLLIFTPANSMMGHGFYQFSPELFYRCLAPAYGYEVERLLVRHNGAWYEAKNPSVIGARVEASTSKPALIYISAVRKSALPIFDPWPIQSDYANIAQSEPLSDGHHSNGLKGWMIAQFSLLADLQARWRVLKASRYRRLENPALFRKLGPTLW